MYLWIALGIVVIGFIATLVWMRIDHGEWPFRKSGN